MEDKRQHFVLDLSSISFLNWFTKHRLILAANINYYCLNEGTVVRRLRY